MWKVSIMEQNEIIKISPSLVTKQTKELFPPTENNNVSQCVTVKEEPLDAEETVKVVDVQMPDSIETIPMTTSLKAKKRTYRKRAESVYIKISSKTKNNRKTATLQAARAEQTNSSKPMVSIPKNLSLSEVTLNSERILMSLERDTQKDEQLSDEQFVLLDSSPDAILKEDQEVQENSAHKSETAKKKPRVLKNELEVTLNRQKDSKVTEQVVEEVIEDIWFVTAMHVKKEVAMRFLVKWDGFPPTENTYEPFEHVAHAEVLKEFVARKFEAHQDRIDAAISIFLDDVRDIYEKYLAKQKSSILKKLAKFNLLQYKCSVLAFIYTYEKIPTSSSFMRMIRYNSIFYKFHLKIEEQNENNHQIATKIMKKEKKAFVIQVENTVDFDVLPNFQYLKKVDNPFKKNLNFGCRCKTCSKDSGCCPLFLGVEFIYDVDHRICASTKSHQMIVECNEFCSCDDSCINRPKKTSISIQIFKTSNGRGWSVKTLDAIPPGTFVVEYTGELIDQTEAQKRSQIYTKTGVTYLFDLDYNDQSEANYSIDATTKGNISRFINHSCEANLQTWPATSCNEKRDMHRLYYFSLRQIRAGEELTVDYSGGVHHGSPVARPKDAIACRCGSSRCKGFTF